MGLKLYLLEREGCVSHSSVDTGSWPWLERAGHPVVPTCSLQGHHSAGEEHVPTYERALSLGSQVQGGGQRGGRLWQCLEVLCSQRQVI